MQVFFPYAMWVVWLGLFVFLLLIEIYTIGLTTIWFAAGALAAAGLDALGVHLVVQIIVFFAVSIVLLIFTRPWAAKHVNQRRIKTNYESRIGEVIKITERVDNLKQTGKSIVNGLEWTVRSKDNNVVLQKDELAKVIDIVGVKLIVERYKEDLS